ncbi:MAG TPA: Rdx family protein [Pseudomonadales bacterium]|nr:Rdx family protein [Pseudomonadales bacterium]
MAARIREVLGVDATLIPGGGGVFDVRVDGERVYSKHETGEFPDDEALVAELARGR